MGKNKHVNLLVLVVLALIPFVTKAFPPTTKNLAGRLVSMELVLDTDELTPVEWPDEPISLTTTTIVVKRDESIDAVLKSQGIRPDAESYTLVYDLNQELKILDPLPVDSRIVVPTVSGGKVIKERLRRGHLVLLSVDKQLKDQLFTSVNALKDLSARFAVLKPASFADAARQKNTIEEVQDIVGWLGHIQVTIAQRTAKPIRLVTLQQLVNESDVLRSILDESLKPDKKLSPADQRQIAEIHADLNKTIERWDESMAGEVPPGEPQFKITVEIRGKDANLRESLRIYYVFAGLFRRPIVNLGQSISTDDFAAWWENVDAGEMVMILDSCYSAAVPGREFRPGPLGDRSFGQLAYDKGMLLLTAAQPDRPAIASLRLGSGRSLIADALVGCLYANLKQPLSKCLKQSEMRVPEQYKALYPNSNEEDTQSPVLLDFTRKR